MEIHSAFQPSSVLPRGLALAPDELSRRLYIAPADPLVEGSVRKLAVLLRQENYVLETIASTAEVMNWAADEAIIAHVEQLVRCIEADRPPFAGLTMDRLRLMGIVNVTPDSFSDGGHYFDTQTAINHGITLLEAGADILDIGGESTRPGALEVSSDEECQRVVPVIRALAERGATVSVDTRHAAVMGAAVEAGARIINDISALEGTDSLRVAAKSGASVILMHMQGDPHTMQQSPHYDAAPLDIYDYLADRLQACRNAGIEDDKLCIDPGIGFGKTAEHNLQVMAWLGLYQAFGLPVLLGASRKTFVARISQGEAPLSRVPGSLAAALAGAERGIHILRVHDVAETAQALAIWKGIRAAA